MMDAASPASSSTSAAVRYGVLPGVVAQDREKALAIWRAAEFGAQQHNYAARYDWLHRNGPRGEGQISFLIDAETQEPLGFLAVGFRDWQVDARPVSAGVLVDFVVLPKHRTALPALSLQRHARERAAQHAQILYGLPDTKAVAIFKRLGSQFQCSLPRFARVVRSGVYLNRVLPRVLALPLALFTDALDLWGMQLQRLGSRCVGTWTEQFDARFDELWRRVPTQGRCIAVRDSEFLTWRFKRQPGHDYRIFAVTPRGGNDLLMYFVCEMAGETLVVKDFLSADADAQLRHGLLALVLAARRLGAVAISMEVNGHPALQRALRRTQFIERGQRPYFAVVAAELRDKVGTQWYITPADEDV